MDIDPNEFRALTEMFSAQKTEILNERLAKAEKETEYWRRRCERAEMLSTATSLQNMYLKNYIMLSVEKIATFVKTLSSVEQYSFLRTFVTCSLPKELQAAETEMIDEIMPLPVAAPKVPPTVNNNFSAGANCQVFNDKVNGSFDSTANI